MAEPTLQRFAKLKKYIITMGGISLIGVGFLSFQNFTYFDSTTGQIADPTNTPVKCNPDGTVKIIPVVVTGPDGQAFGEYPTVQAAIDNAPPGSKINLPPLVFHESVTIPANKPGLSLVGQPGSALDAVLIDGASNTTIEGLSLTGPAGRAALTVLGAADGAATGIKIINNNISSGSPYSKACVAVTGKISDIQITGTKIHDCQEAGLVLGAPSNGRKNPDVIQGMISGNQIEYTLGDGIKVAGPANLDINSNSVTHSGRNRDGGSTPGGSYGLNIATPTVAADAPQVRTCGNRLFKNTGRGVASKSSADISNYALNQATCENQTSNGGDGAGSIKVVKNPPITILPTCAISPTTSESVIPCPIAINTPDSATVVVYRNGKLLMTTTAKELKNLGLVPGNNDYQINVTDASGASGTLRFRVVNTPPSEGSGVPSGDLPPVTTVTGGTVRSEPLLVPELAGGGGNPFGPKPSFVAKINGDPDAVLIINGVASGQSAIIQPGDRVQIETVGGPSGTSKSVQFNLGGGSGKFVVKSEIPFSPVAGSPGAIDPIPPFGSGDGDGPGYLDPRTVVAGSGGGDEKCISNNGELFRLSRNDPNHYCRFVGKVCPADWKYMGYNSTKGRHCETNLTYGTNRKELYPQYQGGIRQCDTSEHRFSGPNIPTETCEYQVCHGPYVNVKEAYFQWGYCNAIGIGPANCPANVVTVGCQYIGQ